MGVQGLWQVLEPAGRPVNVNSLRGKVLAVDVSIWLHQLVKGYRDKDGNPLPNAHLLGVFHRVCKLLHYGIKPVFVFDGGVPNLKRQTLALRKKQKIEALDKSEEFRQKILSNFIRQQLQRQIKKALPPAMRMEEQIKALSSSKSRTPSPKKKLRGDAEASTSGASQSNEDVFEKELQAFRDKFTARVNDDEDAIAGGGDSEARGDSESSDDDDYGRSYGMDYSENFSAIVSSDFDTLPLETQHEILFEMQESRKMNSWGRIEQMPQSLQDFSSYQMDRLVKRRFLQKKIQSVQQEMGQRHIHVQNLDELLKMEYNFDESTKILGSQEKGCILIKNKSQEEDKSEMKLKQEETPGPSSSELKRDPEVITIDDFVEDGWSSSSEDAVIVEENANVARTFNGKVLNPEKESKCTPKSKSPIDVDEDEQLALAIQMSLIESKSENPHTATLLESNENKEVSKLVNILEATGPDFVSSLAKSIDKDEKDEGTNLKIGYGTSENTFINKLETSQLSSCSKFLDTVGFSSKVSSVRPSPKSSDVRMVKNSESESSDSDFEAVEADTDDTSQEFNERNLAHKLLQSTPLDKKNKSLRSTQNSSTVATIVLGEIVMTAPEDDIFADIFNKEIEDLTPAAASLQQKNTVDTEDNKTLDENGDDGDTNWDSDPEVSLVSELESNFSTSSTTTTGSTKTIVPLPIRNPSQEEFLKKLSQVPGPKKVTESVTSSASENNQRINRTLGRFPTQAGSSAGVKMITAEYMQAQDKLNTEHDKLQSARGNQERIATSISDQMNIETQELISLFGIPYVTSPTEAESQCAFLDTACLTEGTITDDSDVWMFGGQRVYKNFYASGDRQLEFYQLADIIKILNLDREKLVLMAMLMGGDYSLGIEGVGPVIALELLAEFPTNSIDAFHTLVKLREWWDIAQTQKEVDVESKVKAKLRTLKLKPGFPNKSVYEAYMSPKIDTSTDAFRWGTPDLDAIRTYAKNKFGWEQSKCDSVLLPVLKNIQCQADKSKQLTLDTYLTSSKFNLQKPYKRKKGSQRLHTAVKKLKGDLPSSELNLSSESDSEEDKVVTKTTNILPSKKNNKMTLQESPSLPPSQSTSKILLPKKNPTIPQKIQEETQRKINKQKAIEILKNKQVPK